MEPIMGRRSKQALTLVACIFGLVISAGMASAMDRRLSERLDYATAEAVWRLVTSVRASGIPTEPLIATALEGASKRARSDRILSAVRSHAAALTTAQLALGRESTHAEVVAGAGALMSGVPPDTLARLRALRPKTSLVVTLVVLADLVTRQVPVGTASMAVIQASRIGARDTDLLRLRTRVEGDIRNGVSPATATLARLQGLGGPAVSERPVGGIRNRERGVP
jgi:hypothetical protein